MGIPEEEVAEKLSKQEKEERRKLDVATERIEEHVTEKSYTKLCLSIIIFINALIFIGVLFLTKSTFAIVLVFGYIIISTLIAFVPFTMNEYEQVGRKPPTIVRWANSFLKKLLPMDRKVMRMGPAILISYIYLVTIGGFIAIGIYTFADFFSGNANVYNYLISTLNTGEYGFFSFISNSAANSLVPSILWYLIIFIPVIFCMLFLIAALYYRNNNISKTLSAVVLLPLVILLPLFLTASSITSPSIAIAGIFLAAWVVTLLIWYRTFTKRNAMIILSIFFTQALASFLVIYSFIFREARFTTGPPDLDISAYFNFTFLTLFFGVLVFIPAVIKLFDYILNGKLKILGMLIAVSAAVAFVFYFFPLFSNSIYHAYPAQQQAAEIYVGFGFLYFYFFTLLIPLFFIFGYFQIGFVRWVYRAIREYGQKIQRSAGFQVLAILIATFFLIGLVFIYYLVLYSADDYQNMFKYIGSLYNGDLIYFLTNSAAISIPPTAWIDLFAVSTLGITMGLLFYSSYRGAYNLALYADQVEDPHKNIRRLGIFNFIIFTSPRSYKTRVIFGISLIVVFLGISAMIAFLKIHTILFLDNFTFLPSPSLIIFSTLDGLKLAVSIVGIFIAIGIFFYFIYKKSKIASGF